MTLTATPTAGAGSARDRLGLARLLDARVRRLVCTTNRNDALIAGLLYALEKQGLALALGHKSLNAYARSVADWGATKTSRMVTLVGHLKQLPEMRKAFFKGELHWTKACIGAAAAVQDPASDAHWTEQVRTKSRDELEQLCREDANEPAMHKFFIALTAAQKAHFDDARVAIQRATGKPVDDATVVSEACRLVAQGGVASVNAGPRPIVALGLCTGCDSVTHGTETVTPAEAAPSICNSEIVDFRSEPPTRRPSIPPRVVAEVLARDQCRCRVPGCDNRTWLDLHHEGGWRNVGHDPERVLTLCASHHRARHEGLLRIVFDSGRATFTLADGEVLGEADLRVLRRGKSAPRGAAEPAIALPPAQMPTPGAAQVAAPAAAEPVRPVPGPGEQREDPKRLAKKALAVLGIRGKDAERALDAAVAALAAPESAVDECASGAPARGELATAELLIKEALRLMPTRGEVAAPMLPTRSAESRSHYAR